MPGASLLRMRIERFTIIVDDYDKAIEFFTGPLGFDLVEDSPSLTASTRPQRSGTRWPGASGSSSGLTTSTPPTSA
jgi:catechol 2,3-dioxygenase-like lactoylglutathione lyase family enzyme